MKLLNKHYQQHCWDVPIFMPLWLDGYIPTLWTLFHNIDVYRNRHNANYNNRRSNNMEQEQCMEVESKGWKAPLIHKHSPNSKPHMWAINQNNPFVFGKKIQSICPFTFSNIYWFLEGYLGSMKYILDKHLEFLSLSLRAPMHRMNHTCIRIREWFQSNVYGKSSQS